MDLDKIKDGRRVAYAIKWRAGVTEGKGKVIQTYNTATGPRVVVHDKTNNRTVTARPSQLKAA